jgi:hypothetical protein
MASPIPKIVITPPKEDSAAELDCEETLSDDDAFHVQQSNNRAGGTKKAAAAASHDSPYESTATKRKRDVKRTARKHVSSDDESSVESASDDEETRAVKKKKAVGQPKKGTKAATTKKATAAPKKATKAPAKKRRKSEESVSDEMDEEELASSDDDGEDVSAQKHKQRGGTLRQKTKNAGNFFRDCFTPERKLKRKLEDSPLVRACPPCVLVQIPTRKRCPCDSPLPRCMHCLPHKQKLMEDSFDKENAPTKAKTGTVAKRTLGRRVKAAN